MDDSGLSHCVVFSCSRPATDGGVYCTEHTSLVPAPSPPAPIDDTPLPGPAPPDMAAMEPHWDGVQWVLKPKAAGDTVGVPREDLEAVRLGLKTLLGMVDRWAE
jgi:hypothetical protein